MLEGTVKVINPLGLHARAAGKLVKLAGRFESSIILARADVDKNANAKSILNVLGLAASIGTVLDVTVNGEDETGAFEAVTDLFMSGFGEL